MVLYYSIQEDNGLILQHTRRQWSYITAYKKTMVPYSYRTQADNGPISLFIAYKKIMVLCIYSCILVDNDPVFIVYKR